MTRVGQYDSFRDELRASVREGPSPSRHPAALPPLLSHPSGGGGPAGGQLAGRRVVTCPGRAVISRSAGSPPGCTMRSPMCPGRAAIGEARSGPVAEGCVGAGVGMRCQGFKSGVGTASRLVEPPGYVVGILVVPNFGS